MKTKRKLLTQKQKDKICEKYNNNEFCDGCPARALIGGELRCFSTVNNLENEIRAYWNGEVEIDL